VGKPLVEHSDWDARRLVTDMTLSAATDDLEVTVFQYGTGKIWHSTQHADRKWVPPDEFAGPPTEPHIGGRVASAARPAPPFLSSLANIFGSLFSRGP
jgi:hypothetical protein